MELSPSILAADLTDLKSLLPVLEKEVEMLHLDVMDGHFVPQLSFGEGYAKFIRKNTAMPLDVHLMVDRPELEVPKYYEFSPRNITFHAEATHFPVRLAREIRKQGILAGLSLNPGTPVSAIEQIAGEFDLFLIMSVEPGFYGQSFIDFCLDKVRQLDNIRKERADCNFFIEADGGISASNVSSVIEAGADWIVAGSALFNGGDSDALVSNVKAMRDAVSVLST